MSENTTFTIQSISPRACGAPALEEFQALVLEGGEVDPISLPGLVKAAPVLAVAKSGNTLVGVGGIKRPNSSYRNRVFKSARAQLNARDFEFELGWVYVRPAAQGNRLASRLVQQLMLPLHGVAVYATSRVNNSRMHASLARVEFRREGTPYPSKMNEPELALFVRV